MKKTTLTFLAATAAFSVQCLAQQLHPLTPEHFHTKVGEQLKLRLSTWDANLASVPWNSSSIKWFFVRVAASQENRDTIAPAEGSSSSASFAIDRAGAALIGIDFKPVEAKVSRKELTDRFHLKAIRLPAEGSSLEIIESSSALVVVGTDGSHSAASSKAALKAEIRPLMDPTALFSGDELAVKFYVEGDKVPGAALTARNIRTGEEIEFSTDANGLCNIKLTSVGIWRLACAYLQPSVKSASPKLFLSTLTFEIER